MNNIEKLMKLPGNTPYHVPLRVRVVAVSATTKYQRDGVEKTSTKIAVADGTGYITAICYDSAKMSMLKLDNSVMLRNYIKKADNTIVINRPTVVSLTSAVTVSEVTKTEAKRHIDALPEAVKIIDAVKVEGTTVTIMGKVTKEEEKTTKQTKNKEMVLQKRVTMKDSTAEVEVTLWRDQANSTLPVGSWQLITDLRLNVFHGVKSFNSTFKTQILQRETPSETSTVVVEGFYGEEELITLVCHSVDDQDTYHDYTITKDILKATFAQEEEDIEKVLLDMLPVTVTLTIKNNNIETIDVV